MVRGESGPVERSLSVQEHLSTVGVLVAASVGATAPSAAAFKYVELKIHTEAPNVQHAIYPLYIEWAMRCAN